MLINRGVPFDRDTFAVNSRRARIHGPYWLHYWHTCVASALQAGPKRSRALSITCVSPPSTRLVHSASFAMLASRSALGDLHAAAARRFCARSDVEVSLRPIL